MRPLRTVLLLFIITVAMPIQATSTVSTAKIAKLGLNTGKTSASSNDFYFNFSAEETILYRFVVESEDVDFLFMTFFNREGKNVGGGFAGTPFTIGGYDFYIIRLTKDLNSADGPFNMTIAIHGDFTETTKTTQPPKNSEENGSNTSSNQSTNNSTTNDMEQAFLPIPLASILVGLVLTAWIARHVLLKAKNAKYHNS